MPAVDQSFVSTGPDAVEARMREQYGTVRLRGDRTAMHERTLAAPEFTLNRMAFTGAFSVVADVPVLSTSLCSGIYRWQVDDEDGDAHSRPVLIRPGHVMHATCGDSHAITATFDLDSLERMARSFYADDGLTVSFDSSVPISRASAQLYRRLLIDAHANLPVLADSDMLRASLYRMMTVGLLECFALHGEPARRRDSVRSRQVGYRRARAFVDDHAAEPISVNDVAAAASLSVPQLDEAVRGHSTTGADATGELRRARLAGAHRDLLAGDPTTGDPGRDVALRWGFAPHNFARVYRETFGQAPRETLEL